MSLDDTVAGRVLHRVTHSSAEPGAGAGSTGGRAAALVLSENWVCYSYWNAKARRSELGVLSLFEGMVAPYDLNPLKVRRDPLTGRPQGAQGSVERPPTRCAGIR